MDDQGDFVVGWLGAPSSSPDPLALSEVLAQVFSGPPSDTRGRPHRRRPGRALRERNVSVAMDAEGDFVVGFDAFGDEIQLERFAADDGANPVAQPISTGASGLNPSVAMDPQGDFAVTWQQINSSGYADYSSGGTVIMARTFHPSGTAIEGTRSP